MCYSTDFFFNDEFDCRCESDCQNYVVDVRTSIEAARSARHKIETVLARL